MRESLSDIFVANSKIYKINKHNFLKKDQMMTSTSKWTLAAPQPHFIIKLRIHISFEIKNSSRL